jgi:hypothetical protein
VETNRIEVGGRRVWRGFWSPARKSRKTEAWLVSLPTFIQLWVPRLLILHVIMPGFKGKRIYSAIKGCQIDSFIPIYKYTYCELRWLNNSVLVKKLTSLLSNEVKFDLVSMPE